MEQAAIKSGAMGPNRRPPALTAGNHSAADASQRRAPDSNPGSSPAIHRIGAIGNTNNDESPGVVGGGVAGVGVGDSPGGGGGGDNLEQIYQSTRTWCRALRGSTNAMEVLIEFERDNPRPQSGILFNQYLSDLTGIMYRRLSTTVEEEARNELIVRGVYYLPDYFILWFGICRAKLLALVYPSTDCRDYSTPQHCASFRQFFFVSGIWLQL